MKLIIAGSRSFTNYSQLEYNVAQHIQVYNLLPEQVTIISGGARGADTLGVTYARNRKMQLIIMPADWNYYGKKAGYIRNKEMAMCATHCIVFWDGISKGSKHMIDIATQFKLQTKVVII